MGTENQITGMASEFYVLSALLRNGVDATLTLGNQKKVDILVNRNGKALTIDVKGLKSTGDFIVGNYKENKNPENHFYIFVYYEDFENVNKNPELFIVPATDISDIVKERGNGTVNNVSLVSLREKYSKDIREAMKIFK